MFDALNSYLPQIYFLIVVSMGCMQPKPQMLKTQQKPIGMDRV